MVALAQSDLFAKALHLLGQQAEWRDMGSDRWLVVRRRVPALGWVGASLRAPVADAATLRRAGPAFVEPEFPLPRYGYVQVMTPATVAEFDLAPDATTRRAAMQGKWRNRLVLAEGAGLTLRVIPAAGAPFDHLLAEEARRRNQRGYRGWPERLLRALAVADPGAVRLHLAERQGTVLAGMLIARHGAGASYLSGWSGDAGRAASAHHLLLWDACNRLSERGVVWLDLGTVDTEMAPGLARFKIGAGAQLRTLGGSWVRLPWSGRSGD